MGTIIALSGWRSSGKDTTGNYLAEEYGFIRMGFADVLKSSTSAQYDIPLQYFYDLNLKDAPLQHMPVNPTDAFGRQIHQMLQVELASGYWTPRALLILEGSTKRSVDPQYWVSQVLEQISVAPELNYVITDMRYVSEANQLKSEFGNAVNTVRVVRQPTIDTTDPSERDLDVYAFDHYLRNTGTIGELHDQIDTLMSLINPTERLREI